MRFLVTGSSGHLGEALVRTLHERGTDVIGLDIRPSEWTNVVGSVSDVDVVAEAMAGVDVVVHTATLHKPQLAFLPRRAFVDTNVSGTLTLLEAAADADVRAFVMSSSTTVFGDALIPAAVEPAAWIDESVVPTPKNVYGVTKAAAEDLCQLAFAIKVCPAWCCGCRASFPNPMTCPTRLTGAAMTTSRPMNMLRGGPGTTARISALRHLGHHAVHIRRLTAVEN